MELWGVLLGAAIAGLFAFVGHYYNRRTEHRQWLRGERQELYKRFITHYQHMDLLITESESRRWEMTDGLTEWPLFPSQEYILLCPKRTSDGILQTVNLIVLLRDDIAQGKPPERLARRRREARNIYEIAVRAMKQDLGT